MYKIYVNNKLFCDSRIDELAIINPVVNLEINAAGSFSFTVAPAHPYYDEIQKRKSVISVYRDDEAEPTFQGICTEENIDFFKQKKVTCEGELTYLNDSILRPQKYQGVTVLTLLTSYIEQHNAQVEEFKRFEIGNVTVTDPNNYILCYTNMNPTLKEIKEDLLDDLGGYLRVRYENGHKYIDYLAESTRYAEQVIELGKNLTDYNSNLSSLDVATRIIPLGARLAQQKIEGLETRLTIESVNDGKDYLQSDTAVEEYGIITKTVEFDGINTASILKLRGQQYLSEVQFENIAIEVKAVDFGYIAKSIKKFELMDNIHIISSAHGMDRWFMLSKMTLNLNDPERDVFTLGKTEKKSLAAKTTQVNQEVLKRVYNMPSSSEMLQAIAQATALITGAEGGNVVINTDENGKPFEFLVLDTDNIETAEDVWRWNINGLGHSSTGYNGTYTTAWTIDGGFNADFISSGTIQGVSLVSIDPNDEHRTEITNGNIRVRSKRGGVVGRITSNYALDETSEWEGNMAIFAGEKSQYLGLGTRENDAAHHIWYWLINYAYNPEWADGHRHILQGKTFLDGALNFGSITRADNQGRINGYVGGLNKSGDNQMMLFSYDKKPIFIGYTNPNEPQQVQNLLRFKPSEDLYPRWAASTWSGTIPIGGLQINVKNGLITGASGYPSDVTGSAYVLGTAGREYGLTFEHGICTHFQED